MISNLYFGGTLHSTSKGIRDSFLIESFYLLETPTKLGGKNSFELFPKDNYGA